uniref:Uncharacterized protein n=1 Tax=Solanum lycopersicum TaxID=4081 RepID=A0A3Q7FLY4_SOLLC
MHQLVSPQEPSLLLDDYILGIVAHEGYCCYFPLSLLSPVYLRANAVLFYTTSFSGTFVRIYPFFRRPCKIPSKSKTTYSILKNALRICKIYVTK